MQHSLDELTRARQSIAHAIDYCIKSYVRCYITFDALNDAMHVLSRAYNRITEDMNHAQTIRKPDAGNVADRANVR